MHSTSKDSPLCSGLKTISIIGLTLSFLKLPFSPILFVSDLLAYITLLVSIYFQSGILLVFFIIFRLFALISTSLLLIVYTQQWVILGSVYTEYSPLVFRYVLAILALQFALDLVSVQFSYRGVREFQGEDKQDLEENQAFVPFRGQGVTIR